ncbi:hypothetical protein CPC08DRAFT_768040 [Agrocybe pediades]|nr:hypothetical protein CPC08DRAFT_768040 [Agrocybe pediades]
MTTSKPSKTKACVGPDGLTKQQRYRLKNRDLVNARSAKARQDARARKRQDIQGELEEAGLGLRTDGLVRDRNLDLKSHVYKTSWKNWAHKAEAILDDVSVVANLKTGWTADQLFTGSQWDEEIKSHIKKGYEIYRKMRYLLRDLAPEICHFEESETRWTLTQNGIETIIRYIADLEAFPFALNE